MKTSNPKIEKKDLRSCKFCDHLFSYKQSRCPSCRMWNTPGQGSTDDDTVPLSKGEHKPIRLIPTGPWDMSFGFRNTPNGPESGIGETAVAVVGGAPGAGKSTMALQLVDSLVKSTKRRVIYVAKEESVDEVKTRAIRLGITESNMDLIQVYPMDAQSDLGYVIQKYEPSGLVLDSLPGFTSDLEQAVAVCKTLKEYSVKYKFPSIVIDHATKADDLAGLRALQHAVDTVLTLFPIDDDKENELRELYGLKNRLGPANFSKLLLMTERGLVDYEDEESEEK